MSLLSGVYCPFIAEKLTQLFLLKEVKISHDGKNDQKFEHLVICFRYYEIFGKICGRMTTIITFSAKMTPVHARALLGFGKFLVS